MTTEVCKTKSDIKQVCLLLDNMSLPCTVNIKKGKDRSVDQNKLQRLWLREAAEQLQDESIEDKRAYIKLHLGVPILRNEDEDFRQAYDEVIRPLPYELKLKAMRVPLDFPVSRLMKTGQMKRYLDDVYHFFTSRGVKLTEPEDGQT